MDLAHEKQSKAMAVSREGQADASTAYRLHLIGFIIMLQEDHGTEVSGCGSALSASTVVL